MHEVGIDDAERYDPIDKRFRFQHIAKVDAGDEAVKAQDPVMGKDLVSISDGLNQRAVSRLSRASFAVLSALQPAKATGIGTVVLTQKLSMTSLVAVGLVMLGFAVLKTDG